MSATMQNTRNLSQQPKAVRSKRYAPWLILCAGLCLAVSMMIATSLIGA